MHKLRLAKADPWSGRARWLGLLAMLFVAIGCVPSLPNKPAMRVNFNEFRQGVHTVCVTSVQLGIVHEKSDPLADKVDAQVVAALRQGGYAVQPLRTAREAWARLVHADGGPIDPYSGRFDVAKYDGLVARHRQELVRAVGCDAFLHARVSVVRAPLNSSVYWDGAWADIGASGMVGWVMATSLWVSLDDVHGNEIYFHTGGIQPLVEVDAGFFSTETRVIGQEKLLADDELLWQGAWLALEPMLPPDRRPRAPDPSGRRVPERPAAQKLQGEKAGDRDEAI